MTIRALVALAVLVPVVAFADPSPGPWVSPLHREWKEHAGRPWEQDPLVPYRVASPLSAGKSPAFTTLGYLPYWNFGDPSLVLHFDQLDVIAYFGAELLSDGTLGETHHWGSDPMDTLIADAHDKGVKVVLTAVNFTPDSIHQVLSSAAIRDQAVANLVGLVVQNGGDGVNVDFEGLPVADKGSFLEFVAALKIAMDDAIGEAHVSVATPAVDWSGAFDYDKLAQACDALMIMGYDYHWKNGEPGPVSPLQGSEKWGKYALDWTLDDYLKWGSPSNRSKFILGLPLYGLDWPTEGPEVPGKAMGSATAVLYDECQDEAVLYGWKWDADSQTPYYVHQSGGWHQVWCEDRQSLAGKFTLAAARKLGGVGFWALGYEGTRQDVWQELAQVFPAEVSSESHPEEGDGAELPSPSDAAITDTGDEVPMTEPNPPEAPGEFPPEAAGSSNCRTGGEGVPGAGPWIPALFAFLLLIFEARRSTMSSVNPGTDERTTS